MKTSKLIFNQQNEADELSNTEPNNSTACYDNIEKICNWLKEAYLGRGTTILNGFVASVIALPVSALVAGPIAENFNFPKVAIGVAAMFVSNLMWNIIYHSELYFFYDRHLMSKDQNGKISKIEFRDQIWRYIKNSILMDFGWIISYQGFYYSIIFFDISPLKAAVTAHVVSIILVDLLRPVILKINKTLIRDRLIRKLPVLWLIK